MPASTAPIPVSPRSPEIATTRPKANDAPASATHSAARAARREKQRGDHQGEPRAGCRPERQGRGERVLRELLKKTARQPERRAAEQRHHEARQGGMGELHIGKHLRLGPEDERQHARGSQIAACREMRPGHDETHDGDQGACASWRKRGQCAAWIACA